MKKYSSLDWIKIDIANLFGKDKLLWDERIQWTDDHFADLEALTEQADKPYQYAEAVKQYLGVLNGEPWTKPIFLDATASGMSIMSILRHDRKTAIATNVIGNGLRNDPYTLFATHFNINRQAAKEALMPYFYSSIATPLDIIGGDRFGEFLNKVAIEFPGPCSVLKVMETLHRDDIDHIEWLAPDGHQCHVKYWQPVDKSIETAGFGKFTYRIYQQAPTDNYRSLAANWTQHLDAWIARQMVRMAHKQGWEIMSIHDAFGALPSNIQQMRENYLVILQQLATWNPTSALNSISGNVGGIWGRYKDPSFTKDILQAEYALS